MEYPHFFYRKYIFKLSMFHCYVRLPECNITLENQPFEDVFRIQNGDFPASRMLVFRGVYLKYILGCLTLPSNTGLNEGF